MAETPLRVAIIGDSVVWGQGLSRDEVFAKRAARQIAEVLNRSVEIVQFTPRSGAKISATHGDMVGFVDRYPHMFQQDDDVGPPCEAVAAEHPADADIQQAAGELFGEIPCPLPSVEHQLHQLIETGGDVDVLFVGGGANDIDFASVVDPRNPRDYVTALDPQFETKVYQPMLGLLRRACEELPRAQIIVTGYYSALSWESNRSQLRSLVRHGFKQELGSVVGTGLFYIYYYLALVSPLRPVGSYIDQAIGQSEYGHSRALYWLRRAVAECNAEQASRRQGPHPPSPVLLPALFVHPAFDAKNALFAENSLIHEDYKLDAMGDAMAAERAEQCPRTEHLDDLILLDSRLGVLWTSEFPEAALRRALDSTHQLLGDLQAPCSLLAVLEELREMLSITLETASRRPNPEVVSRARDALDREIGEITICVIASFFHPKQAGADRYTERILDRWRMARQHWEAAPEHATSPGTTTEAEDRRHRYRIPEEHVLAEFDSIDSIAVRITMREDSGTPFYDFIDLDLGNGHTWRLGHRSHTRENPHFQPGAEELFTIDPLDTVKLTDIQHLILRRTQNPEGPIPGGPFDDSWEGDHWIWRPERVELALNGVTVFRSDVIDRTIGLGELVLPYPLVPVEVPPVVGRREAQAVRAIEALGLVPERKIPEFSDESPGSVASQQPDPGTEIEIGSQVAYTPSRGPLPIPPDARTVPDVVGMREETARSALQQVGFRPVVAGVADSDRPHLEVIAQQPREGTRVTPGAEVALTLSTGRGTGPGGGNDGGRPVEPL